MALKRGYPTYVKDEGVAPDRAAAAKASEDGKTSQDGFAHGDQCAAVHGTVRIRVVHAAQ